MKSNHQREEADNAQYLSLISEAIEALKARDYVRAAIVAQAAFKSHTEDPHIHLVYGIIAEGEQDFLLAAKHYRAALAMDPSFDAAIRNLDRVTTLRPEYIQDHPPFYGEIKNEDTQQKKRHFFG